MPSSSSSSRLGSLDALRGLAALAVVLFHYLPYYHEIYGHGFALWPWLSNSLSFGRYGVHLFFMLSGFVIFMTLERTAHAGWFGAARALRLLPALWAGIVITVISVHWLGPQDRAVNLSTALANAFLIHEYLGLKPVDGAYWSLVIEVTFYSWMALLYFTLKSWRALRIALWLWVLTSYAGVVWWQQIPDGLEFLVKDLLFVKYAPLFIAGMLIYRIYRYGRPAPVDAALLALTVCHGLFAYKFPYSLFVLGCFAIFSLAVAGRLNGLANAPLLWLGRLSYSLYLIHQNVGYGVIGWSYNAGLPGWLGVCLALGMSLLLACTVHYSIEQPALRWFRVWRTRADTARNVTAPTS